jgi:DNA-binding NtrC family response regulator
MRHHIVVVDDEPTSRKGLQDLLTAWGYEATSAADGVEALVRVGESSPAVVICDLVMPKLDGIALLTALKRDHPGTEVILLTGQGSIESAVQAMKDGAYDYLTKPADPVRLRVVLQKALERRETVREVHRLTRELRQRGAFGQMVAGAPQMLEITRQLELVAPTDATVFIVGESGTGKELVARTVHEHSERRQGPFVPINCAAIPDTLLESEIFGHEKGAFTGAGSRRQGCFELADRGTLFLDEVAEMQPVTQVKFLRVLQESQFRRLGGTTEIAVNVRVIAATNKNPLKAVEDGSLREDLYYRLNVFTISLPPLRERKEDLPALVETFLEEFNQRHQRSVRGVDNAAFAVLRQYGWPGNIRELRNVLERAVILCPDELVRVDHLPQPPASSPSGTVESGVAGSRGDAGDVELRLPVGTTVEDAERQLILRTLAHAENNKTRTAEILGISLKTLHNKLHKYRA